MATVLLTGAAGFIGSHLLDGLLARGDRVLAIDNLLTGQVRNVEHHFAEMPSGKKHSHTAVASVQLDGQLYWQTEDVCEGVRVPRGYEPSVVMHLASPASPRDYPRMPFETMAVNSAGTEEAIRTALRFDARFVYASTSEVYGDPEVSPQSERYWGNVNPYGPRSVYDEAKRFGEALCRTYADHRDLNVAAVRIFNAYGPRLRADDGRVVSEFINRALANEPLVLQGGGRQTRSFCYIDDMVAGLLAVADSELQGPVNVGNPRETSIYVLAQLLKDALGSSSEIVEGPMPEDDPKMRCPDITRVREATGWEPKVDLGEGLASTVEYFQELRAERIEVSDLLSHD